MIIDRFNTFSKAQSIVGNAATAIPSDYTIDRKSAGDAWDDEPYLHIRIDTTVLAAGGAANVTFKLETDSDSAFGTAVQLWASAAIPKATLVAGYFVTGNGVRLPKGAKQYLRVTATPDTNNTTAGKIDAFLSPDVQANLFKTTATGQG